MAAADGALIDPIREKFNAYLWRLAKNQTEIHLATLGNDAGSVGAAGWFLHLYEEKQRSAKNNV